MAMIKSENEVIYAAERISCKSILLRDLINSFGQNEGFQKVLDIIAKEDTTLEHVFYILDWMSKCSKMFHRSFVLQYWQKLLDTVQDKVLQAPEAQLRKINKSRVDDLVVCLWDRLMDRLFAYQDTQIKKQIFNLDIGIRFLS